MEYRNNQRTKRPVKVASVEMFCDSVIRRSNTLIPIVAQCLIHI